MDRDDAGLSLIELIIFIVMLGILTVGLTTILANMWTTQTNIDAQTRATTRGQLVASEIEKAMRNATGFQVSDGGSTLLVETSFSDSRKCQAFHVAPASAAYPTGAMQMIISGLPAPVATDGFAWQRGISSSPGATFAYVYVADDPSSNPTPIGVHYSFTATAPSTSAHPGPVAFDGRAYARNNPVTVSPEGVSTCWPL